MRLLKPNRGPLLHYFGYIMPWLQPAYHFDTNRQFDKSMVRIPSNLLHDIVWFWTLSISDFFSPYCQTLTQSGSNRQYIYDITSSPRVHSVVPVADFYAGLSTMSSITLTETSPVKTLTTTSSTARPKTSPAKNFTTITLPATLVISSSVGEPSKLSNYRWRYLGRFNYWYGHRFLSKNLRERRHSSVLPRNQSTDVGLVLWLDLATQFTTTGKRPPLIIARLH